MRIQHQIFFTILLIFTCVFGLATWFYYIHFNESLNRAESQQAQQINQYVESEIKTLLRDHQEKMERLDRDGDLISAYDAVDWLSFMGRKFIAKTVNALFEQDPYLQRFIFTKDNQPYINLTTSTAIRHSDSWIIQKRALNVPNGTLTLYSDILGALQTHLRTHKIKKTTKLYFENDKGAWLVSAENVKRLPLPIKPDRHNVINLENTQYLASQQLGNENWFVQSLISQQETKEVLHELLVKTVFAYTISALLFFGIARYLSLLIIRPLHRLEHAAKAIKDGTYSPIDIAQTTDETRPAIEAFNSMSQRIQGFTQELQEQVAARTKELEIANTELALMNETDVLTGARSRQFLTHHASSLVTLAHRSGLSLGVAMLDIDYFKKINDTYGHVKGDECLIAFVDALHKNFRRDNDWVTRYGGEEFFLICFGLNHEDFHNKLETFRNSVKDIHLKSDDGEEIRFTVSIGYNHYTHAPQQWSDAFISRADALLYKAKRNGRNQTIGEEFPS
ncbi:MAG: diguanylate cyclase [Methylocystaceae bacterium]|nr:diguanylate cyclase [Methylocystaceae bacterium]